MRVLIVANYRHGYYAPFIEEQVDGLVAAGVVVEYFPVVAKGVFGYLNLRKPLLKKIKEFSPDIIHAHYGLSSLLANLQRKIAVVSTYHGSDINLPLVRPFSRVAMILSSYNIFVSHRGIEMVKPRSNFALIPCGVNLDNFTYVDRSEARRRLGLNESAKLVLFAGAFSNRVKNYPLAKGAVDLLDGVELIELKGYTREEVNLLMQAVDLSLMTSFTEGSPQFIKEAMACGCPIVSVDVGDVCWVMGGTDGCYITSYEVNDIAEKIEIALQFSKIKGKTVGRDHIIEIGLCGKNVTKNILSIYSTIINSHK